jgi:hypothetical protein
MTRHPDIARLRRFAASELVGTVRTRTARHLEHCDACRRTSRWTDEVVRTAALATAPPAPADAWTAIERRVRRDEALILPVAGPARAAAQPLRGVRIAALALFVAGGLAAAVPGSPLRAWIERTMGAAVTETDARPPAGEPAGTAPEVTYVLPAAAGSAVVALERPAGGVELRVRVGAVDELEVHLQGAAVDAQVRTAAGRLTISGATGGQVQVVLPAALGAARIEVNGVVYLTKQGATVTVLAAEADSLGPEIILPIRPGGTP